MAKGITNLSLGAKPLNDVRAEVSVKDAGKDEKASQKDWPRISVQISDEERLAWKSAALKRRTSLSDLIREAMAKHLGGDK